MFRPSNSVVVLLAFAVASFGSMVMAIDDKIQDMAPENEELMRTTGGPEMCGTTNYTTSGYISSPNYPDCYPNNARCDWSVRLAPPGQVAFYFFLPFGLESCCDYVEIYDGPDSNSPLIGKYTGQQRPPGYIYSTGRDAFVQFYTDGSVVNTGFEIYWYFVYQAGVAKESERENHEELQPNMTRIRERQTLRDSETNSSIAICNPWSSTPDPTPWPTTTTWPPTTTTTWPPTTTTTWPPTTTTPWPGDCRDRPCPPGQYCENGWCRCEDQIYSTNYYDEYDCRRRVGASCSLNPMDPGYQECVPQSICVRRNATHGRCECQVGFVGTGNGFCEGDYGSACDRFNSRFGRCSEQLLLMCRDERCICASPSLEYEFDSGRGCVAPEGEPCGIRYGIDGHQVLQCAEGLMCVEWASGSFKCEAGGNKIQ